MAKAKGTKTAKAAPKAKSSAAAKKASAKVSAASALRAAREAVSAAQPLVGEQLLRPAGRPAPGDARPLTLGALQQRLDGLKIKPSVDLPRLLAAVNRIDPDAAPAFDRLPEDIRASIAALKPAVKSFHGAKASLLWFPWPWLVSPCGDRFGYMTPASVRSATRLDFNVTNQALLNQLGNLMADSGRETAPDTAIPAGFTYVGQFVDHDITLDVSSSLDASADANTIHNMRTPSLDLDSVYGRGPALDPFLYAFPSSGPPTAIKMQLGSNLNNGPGGPAGTAGTPGAMVTQTDFDVPRVHNPINPAAASLTAIIGDPRNDENLIVSQLHHAMLRFHNAVIDLLLAAAFTGDHFAEAKRVVTHHYQWAVVNDFLRRVCGDAAVDDALDKVKPAVGSAFRMPVEFAVAAYRFGHSMIRDQYWLNFNFTDATLGQVFEFIRKPNLPVRSNWVVDFNAFFETGVTVPVNNKARPIDSVLGNKLEDLPGFSGMMAVLATRNLRRGLSLGLPSGQGVANHFGVAPLTATEIKQGLPPNEVAVLDSQGGVLLQKTPLWYYVLREAAVREGGARLGPVGAKIVADTFVRILRRDASSYLNASGGFTPFLPSTVTGQFTFADLLIFAGVTQP